MKGLVARIVLLAIGAAEGAAVPMVYGDRLVVPSHAAAAALMYGIYVGAPMVMVLMMPLLVIGLTRLAHEIRDPGETGLRMPAWRGDLFRALWRGDPLPMLHLAGWGMIAVGCTGVVTAAAVHGYRPLLLLHLLMFAAYGVSTLLGVRWTVRRLRAEQGGPAGWP